MPSSYTQIVNVYTMYISTVVPYVKSICVWDYSPASGVNEGCVGRLEIGRLWDPVTSRVNKFSALCLIYVTGIPKFVSRS